MAFGANCGPSTVLVCCAWRELPGSSHRENGGEQERAVGALVGFCPACLPALRNSDTPTQAPRQKIEVSGRQIRNSKFEIQEPPLLNINPPHRAPRASQRIDSGRQRNFAVECFPTEEVDHGDKEENCG